MFKRLAILLLTIACAAAHAETRPRIRAITAFVRIDRDNYETQLADANKMLQAAKAEYVKAGYEVQTVRITTQPFPLYVKGMPDADALAFLRELDKLAKGGGYAFNISPVTMTDDTSSFELLGEFLVHAQSTNSSAIVAGEDGIHWKTVQASAKLVKYLENNSPHSQGNSVSRRRRFFLPMRHFFPARGMTVPDINSRSDGRAPTSWKRHLPIRDMISQQQARG